MDRRSAAVVIGLACPFFAVVAAQAAETCDGHRATIVGTPGSDVLNGTAGNDVIVGLGGDDTVRGRGGDDHICGGDGDDSLYGGSGRDRIFGGRDRLLVDEEGSVERIGDRLRGGHGPDRLVPGRDTRPADDITPDLVSWSTSPRGVRVDIARGTAAGDGADRFVAAGAAVEGSPYADVVTGSAGADEIHGRGGRDALYGYWGDDTISDGAGNDVSWGGAGRDQVTGGTGRDELHGGPDADVVSDGEPGANRLYGDTGNDLVIAQLSRLRSVIDGGTGTDTLSLSSFLVNGAGSPSRGSWNMGTGSLSFSGAVTAVATAVRVEDVDLSTFGTSWRVTGTSGPEALDALSTRGTRFDARGGDDTFQGSAFSDVFLGGSGTDRSPGLGAGRDTCVSVEVQPDCEIATP
jgi:Ca2+-binding RTX toxin-like protein